VTEFLRHPELFPARIAGERWGNEQREIELAGDLYRIDGLTETQVEGLEERYASRLRSASDAQAAVTLHLFQAPPSDFLEIDTRGWEYALDLQWTESAFTIRGMRVMARVDLERREGGIWTSVTDGGELWGIVENVLRPLVAARLLATGGLLVHSAAVQGLLFAARSGGGKSTIARSAINAGLPVLSDDLNALIREDDGFAIAPLPFTGDLELHETSEEATPLRMVVSLDKGDSERLRPLSLIDGVSLLVRCAPYINLDEARTPLLLDRAAEIAARVERRVLTFRRDGDLWPILLEGPPTP
jgi:hypothetical protein